MLRMELAEGVILDGHYRLRQLLGRGGMGEVWEAEHTRLPKQFAIKFLLALSRTEPELLMRFRREAEIASRLSHPSIVQVTDFNILPDGTAYIAMERLIGEDLRGRLARGPLSLSEVREITRQVASALTLAHREGIVHRDLKPENIFLCREADGALRAKVLDFGISKLHGAVHGTRDDRVLGTPGYMAPEQARGKNSAIDGRTDLFSLATIVYEMLTGKGVFMGDTLAELCTKVLYHTPPPLDQVLPSVPRPIALAVSMALSKDPAARQADIGLFADAVVGSSSPPSASSGFSPTLASNVASLASLQARALAAETQALAPVPVDASDVVTRSERPSLPAQSQPARAGTKRMIAAASAGILLLLGSVAWWQVRRDHATTPRTQALELPHTTAVSAPPALPSRAARPPADELAHGEPARTQPAVEPNTPAATRDTLSGPDTAQSRGAHGERAAQGKVRSIDPGSLTAKTEETGSRTRASEPERTLPASAKAALDDAERALQQGDVVNALRLARSSLRETSSERAYLLMARAYCRQRDVGMVQAMLRNLSPARRLQVQADCQSHGLTVP